MCALLLRLLWFIYVFTVFLCHHDHRFCCRQHHQEVCAQLTFLHAQTFMFPYSSIASFDFLFFFFIETQMAWQRDAPVQTKTGCRHRETSPRRRREGKNRSQLQEPAVKWSTTTVCAFAHWILMTIWWFTKPYPCPDFPAIIYNAPHP